MKRAFIFLSVWMVGLTVTLSAQGILPHFEGHHWIQKAGVTTGKLYFSQFRPGNSQKTARLFGQDSTLSGYRQVAAQANEYFGIRSDSSGRFYRNRIDFFQLDREELTLRVNPVWQLQAGRDPQVDRMLFINSRGLDVRGTIDGRLYFHTRFLENQVEYPRYVKNIADTSGIIPFEGFWKEYNETTTDFLRAVGAVGMGLTEHVNLELGYGRQFIGNGIRSMLLSDYANSYPYFKIDTEIWKFKYTNLYASLTADVFTYAGGTLGASVYPRKQMAAHFLDFAFTPRFHIGLFEAIIYGQPDSVAANSLNLEYLNPIIFYRAVEQQDGSSANALMGATFQWQIFKKGMLYGQFLLDEMVISELTGGNDWWGNKYAYQIGIQGYDLGVKDLDLKVEYNMARPYTYAHQDAYTAYTQYRMPLAHPMGANFREVIGQLVYRPTERLTLWVHGLLAASGADVDSVNTGKNPQRSYNERPSDYGVRLLQGKRTDLTMVQFRASYDWKYNLSLDLVGIIRRESFAGSPAERQDTNIVTLGFRWNIPYRNYLF